MAIKESSTANVQPSTGIHPTAVVDPAARIGQGVTIGPYAVVEHNTEIGGGSRIDSCARICCAMLC